MNEQEIRTLLISFKNSEHYSMWRNKRLMRYDYNHNWIDYIKINSMSDQELKEKFLEYYGGGEGRQVFNQIWRDRIIRDVSTFKKRFLFLLDEKLPLDKRFTDIVSSNGDKHIDGVGKALASGFLMDLNNEKYCIWNNKTEMGFNVLGIETPYISNDTYGTRYVKVLDQLKRIKDDIGAGLNYDYDSIDSFLHWVSAEEEGKIAVKKLIGEETLTETGIVIEAPEEKFVQKLIERNFDNIFSYHNLKLYDNDPDQNGFQYNTKVGRIDFLCIDKNTDDIVVIELKTGKVTEGAIGQVMKYMGFIQEEILSEGHKVRGILLGEDLDDKARYALKLVPQIEFKKYKLNIDII